MIRLAIAASDTYTKRYLQAKIMRTINNILIISSLVLFSCNEKDKNQTTENKLHPITESKINSKAETKKVADYEASAELFVKDVLKENLRKQTFEINDTKRPKHTEIFDNVGLQNITAYSNKNYPKNSEPFRYEHFTLFVANYQSELNALKTFALITMTSKEDLPKYQLAQKKFVQRVKAINIGAKPGGMIVQAGNQIFSLVETCREAPIDGNWQEFENKFLNYIVKEGKEIEVLNSDCGKDRYSIEKRKASR